MGNKGSSNSSGALTVQPYPKGRALLPPAVGERDFDQCVLAVSAACAGVFADASAHAGHLVGIRDALIEEVGTSSSTVVWTEAVFVCGVLRALGESLTADPREVARAAEASARAFGQLHTKQVPYAVRMANFVQACYRVAQSGGTTGVEDLAFLATSLASDVEQFAAPHHRQPQPTGTLSSDLKFALGLF